MIDIKDGVFKEVFTQIDKLLQTDKQTIIVSIDGMCGSGKTTLGEALKQVYDCNLIHMDDFFLQSHQRTPERMKQVGGNVDYERFYEEVICHLQDAQGFSYGVFDCSRLQITERIQLPFKRLNIIEGSYSAHPYFGAKEDLRFFLEVSEEEQKRRLLNRNGEAMLKRFVEEWIPKEQAYFEKFGIRESSICLNTDSQEMQAGSNRNQIDRKENTMIGLIVAYSKNRVIGKDGQIPWRIKGEQKRFRELTTGNIVIMGRRSYEEIGRPLPNRYTIVVSNTRKFEAENCTTAGSLEEAIRIADKGKNIYISGGAGLYREAIDIVDKMFITEIDAVVEGDTYFPEFNEADFVKEVECHVGGDMPYDYVTYTRMKK